MNDALRAGVSARLELHIAAKQYIAASGARHEVLREIVLSLGEGEVAAILGPSGCGKTTLLRIVAGLDTDFEGSVTFAGKGRSHPPKMGMVFQEPRLLPWRTVEQNLLLAAPGASAAAIDRLLADFGLSSHARHFPGELSLGLARRVALARAFAVEPDILLPDEPFASLDARLAGSLRHELAKLVSRNRATTLLVTHDVDDAIELADRIFLLSQRPARIIGIVPIETPRSLRSPERLAAIGRDVIARGVGPER
ncbi:MAG: ATP-binding cassette domain-containing protein [Methylobacteriaceae bacterium]|nr:ATP-binding cassette domain-containing protein [Methylobacteriaceae bacterium]MBV9705472.1 ATP-binding cassette domain-containing protein [Methylobacteriaceae bacterium]